MEGANSTKVITGMVRFSYLHVFEPTAIDENSEKKYSASLIIPKSDTATIGKINAVVKQLKEQAKAKYGGKLPAKFKEPLRDGDEERPDDEAYANSYFINTSCKTKPGLVDKDLNPIMSQDDLYSGAYGRASVNFYLFDTKGNKGIACGLNNLQKLKDGEFLGGRSKAEDDFSEPIELDDDIL